MALKGISAGVAASAYGVTAPTARKWLGRYLALGQAGLSDASPDAHAAIEHQRHGFLDLLGLGQSHQRRSGSIELAAAMVGQGHHIRAGLFRPLHVAREIRPLMTGLPRHSWRMCAMCCPFRWARRTDHLHRSALGAR